jgi:hypothetical protein
MRHTNIVTSQKYNARRTNETFLFRAFQPSIHGLKARNKLLLGEAASRNKKFRAFQKCIFFRSASHPPILAQCKKTTFGQKSETPLFRDWRAGAWASSSSGALGKDPGQVDQSLYVVFNNL